MRKTEKENGRKGRDNSWTEGEQEEKEADKVRDDGRRREEHERGMMKKAKVGEIEEKEKKFSSKTEMRKMQKEVAPALNETLLSYRFITGV